MRWFGSSRGDQQQADREARDARERAELGRAQQRAEGQLGQAEGFSARPGAQTERGEGVTHTGPGTVNITGQAVGRQGPARDQGRTAAHREYEAGSGEPGAPYVVNTGRHGQINMDRSAVGPGAHVSIRGGEVTFGSDTQPEQDLDADREAGS
jgi:hypothetical protein